MLRHTVENARDAFDAGHANFWGNLIRLNNLLVIVNISMFFLTGLVAKGYFYTFYSLVCLGVVGVGVLIPTTLIRRLWYYWIFPATELCGLYFLVASVVYWINNGSG
ncbi:hypothetical protein DSCA_33420 [Desulfosarcina alkanivorans]|uniref:Uncharacterized protein n=1 Tax=Desulfosarcina alkanivorans TaxID=571177 RepID=A0A5K7YIC0_9BACT|nr:hypothetical protein [Desulfosarcina alkanivorans]BBO69412.1 hypothetical protein DSCA_33420 [Desulfosarcina alkanivorans]